MDNYQITSYSGAEIEALLDKIDDLGSASQSTAGLMSAADKTKLDGLDSGAQANVIEGVKIAGADLPIAEKKVNIPVDSSPTSGSNSLVRSGGVFNAIKDFITSSVNDLVYYYTKSETYTKTEVNNIIGSLQQFHYEIYASTSAVTNPQSNVLYLIGPTGTGSDKYEEYVYSNGWVKIGDTTIDLSGYSTTEQMNAAINNALQDYATKEEVSQLGQQIDAVVYDKILNRNGNVVESAGWAYDTNYRQYVSGNNVEWRFSKNTANNTAAIVFYNSNKQVVEFWLASSSDGYTIIAANNIPSTAAYFRFSFKSSDINDVYCKMGSTTYRPKGVVNDLNYYINEQSKTASYKKLYLSFNYDTNQIRITQKYSNTKDIQIVLAPFGVNGLVQMYGWGFLGNTNELVTTRTASISTTGTDWVSPYIMKLSGVSGSSDWTGGCHGSNGASGNPTAELVDVKVYADDRLCTSSANSYANTVRVVVTNDIKAGNALSSGYCLREEVTYLFKDGKIFVSVRSKVLQNIDLQVYYGTAVTNYSSEIYYLGKSVQKNNFTAASRFTERCNGFVCVNSDNEYLIARIDSVGLAKQECNYYAHAATTGKAYFCFVNQDIEPIHYNTGDEFYWSGSYQFSEKFDITEMNGLLEIETDDTPTKGSHKLITSGAVYDSDNDIKKGFDNTVAGYYLNRYDTPVSDAEWSYSDYVLYTQGEQVEVRFSNGTPNANAAILFYDSSYQKVEFRLCNSPTGNTFITTGIPVTAAYIRYSFKTSDIDNVYCKVGNNVSRPSGIVNEFNRFKTGNTKNLSYKKNNVFYGDAIANTSISDSLKEKILSGIKRINIWGFDKSDKLFISTLKIVATASTVTQFQVTISRINDDSISEVCAFIYVVGSSSGIITIKPNNVANHNCYNAELEFDTDVIGTDLFNAINVTTLDSTTFEKYGLSSDCLYDEEFDSAIQGNDYKRLKGTLRELCFSNLDTTRNYKLKKFSYNRTNGLLSVEVCTDENFNIGPDGIFQAMVNPTDAVGIKTVTTTEGSASIDFGIANSVFTHSFSAVSIQTALGIHINRTTPCVTLSAGEEMTMTYDGQPLRVLDCGKLTGKFYLNCGRKIFTTEHIVKQTYVANDTALTLLYELPDTVTRDQTVYERFEYVNGIKELNTGKVLVNVAIQTADNEDFNNLNRGGSTAMDIFSKYYMWDGTNMTYLFEGGYAGAKYTDGWVKRGGFCNMVWDFYEWENYIFVSERNGQGYGGKAWMSNDYGTTWYLIFNAYPDMNWIYKNPPYPFRNPSGFDSEHGDFDRQVGGKPNFHIHGIAYDHWRNQVIIVSGDATNVKGSYTAVWVWKNPQNITLWPEQTYEGGYSGTEVYPIGGTNAANPVKMLNNTWTRVSLHSDDTGLPGNAQFVGCIPFKDCLAFTTDNNMPGGNGIIINTYPDNIVSSNFRIAYPLSPDIEGNTLTHCGGGYMFLQNLCLASLHRENSTGMIEGSERRGAVLASTNGKIWKRVFVDDTLDTELHTQLSWGMTMIGKNGELYLRYKGFKPEDNKIRVMRLY